MEFKEFREQQEKAWQKRRDSINAVLTKHGIDPASVRCGAECGIGWHPLIDKLLGDLVALGWNKELDQIKEKFGALRVYIKSTEPHNNDAIRNAILHAEDLSLTICEYCGAEGKRRSGGWVKTLCDSCDAERH